MEDTLLQRATKEFDDYKRDLKSLPVNEIINSSYIKGCEGMLEGYLKVLIGVNKAKLGLLIPLIFSIIICALVLSFGEVESSKLILDINVILLPFLITFNITSKTMMKNRFTFSNEIKELYMYLYRWTIICNICAIVVYLLVYFVFTRYLISLEVLKISDSYSIELSVDLVIKSVVMLTLVYSAFLNLQLIYVIIKSANSIGDKRR